MFCTHCGAHLEDGDRFCTSCGMPVPQKDAADDKTRVLAGQRPSADETHELGFGESAPNPSAETFELDPFEPQTGPVQQPFPQQPPSQQQGGGFQQQPPYQQPYQGQPQTGRTPLGDWPEPPAQPYPGPQTNSYQQPYQGGPTPPTMQMPPVQPPRSGKKGLSPVLIGVLACVVTVAVIGVAWGVGSSRLGWHLPTPFGGGSSTASSSPATSSKTTSSATSTQNAASTNATSASVDDSQIRTTLTSYYNDLSGFDTDIKNCANDFNSNYLSSSMSTRQNCYAVSGSTANDIHARYTALQQVSVPTTSAYHSTYQDILTCYDDLCHRIDVINESWTIDLQYSDPSSHQSEITAPISRDNVGTINKYKTDFDNRYPTCKP